MLEIHTSSAVEQKKQTRRRYPERDDIYNNRSKVYGNQTLDKKNSLHAVIIDVGMTNHQLSQDLQFSFSWIDRVKHGWHHVKVNIYDGMAAGAIIGIGVAIGTGVATAATLALPAPELESIKGLIIGIGVAGGALGGIGVGFADAPRVDTRALSSAAVSAIATGAFEVFQVIETHDESPNDIVTMATRTVIAATAAAFAGGIITSVASGIFIYKLRFAIKNQ